MSGTSIVGISRELCFCVLCRLQYQEVLKLPVRDIQLMSMCQSLWNRLRYLRRKRHELPAVTFVDKSES